MDIKIIVNWDPAKKFSDASKLEAILSITKNKKTEEMSMSFDNSSKIENYKDGIIYKGFGITRDSHYFNIIKEEKGLQEYKLESSKYNKNKINIEKFRKGCRDFHRKHNIITRNEIVQHEQFCKFFGSSGFVWDTEKCNYKTGTYDEQLIQTLYEMEHYNPKIYKWTNSNGARKIAEKMEREPEFTRHYNKNIKPILQEPFEKNNLQKLINELKKIPELQDYTLNFD